MGRTGSTIRARLSMLINIIVELQAKEGFISTRELAERTSLTDRAIRDYLDMLSTLNVLKYIGAGKYKLNRAQFDAVFTSTVMEPRFQYTLEDFMTSDQILKLAKIAPLESKVRRILERINLEYLISDRLRADLQKIKIDDDLRMEGLVGDRLIIRKAAKEVIFDDQWFAGTCGAYDLKNFRVFTWAVFTVVYLSAGGYLGYYRMNLLDQNRSKLFHKPDFETYRGKDPFLPGDPFYELTTDFPELLMAGRNIAARYLMELLHYGQDYELIKEHGDKFNLLLRHGTILPHGFIVKSKSLMELRDRTNEMFFKVMGEAKKRGITVVGVSIDPHDNLLIRILGKVKGIKIGETSDMNLMYGVLNDGDATCLIRRPTERGRPTVDNWYEFYLRQKDTVLKFEMLSDNPEDDQKRLLDILYSLSVPTPLKGVVSGPGIVQGAHYLALQNLTYLKRTITMSLNAGFQTFMESLQKEKEERMKKKYLEGGKND